MSGTDPKDRDITRHSIAQEYIREIKKFIGTDKQNPIHVALSVLKNQFVNSCIPDPFLVKEALEKMSLLLLKLYKLELLIQGLFRNRTTNDSYIVVILTNVFITIIFLMLINHF
jgi:hypothetical protein